MQQNSHELKEGLDLIYPLSECLFLNEWMNDFCCLINSDETTKDVISMLLKKFHILDNPRKFALYEQELNEKGKIGGYLTTALAHTVGISQNQEVLISIEHCWIGSESIG